jgi:hypothetical protein
VLDPISARSVFELPLGTGNSTGAPPSAMAFPTGAAPNDFAGLDFTNSTGFVAWAESSAIDYARVTTR